MYSRRRAAFTWVEVLVAIFVLVALLVVAGLLHLRNSDRSHESPLSQMKQLHLATQAMALDGVTTGDTNLAWPGSQDGRFSTWVASIVPSYLSANDFNKLISFPYLPNDPRQLPTQNQNAILVYAVTEEQDGSHVFLTTANFTNTPSGGSPLRADAKPYGDKGFVVFRKGGDGAILLRNQVGKTNLIGTYTPLLH